MKNVFVSVISFNNTKATLECLESLEKIKRNDFKLNVIVIDNSTDEKFSTNKKYNNFELEILKSETNLGFSGGQNLGIKYALKKNADFIVILNNDTVVDENLINNLLNSFKGNTGIVCPKIYFAKGFEFHKDRYKDNEKGKVIWYAGGIMDFKNVIGKHRGVDQVDKGQFDQEIETDYATGCCMMIKSEVFQKVGYLDDKYFLYYEDADFSMRARQLGFKILFVPKAFMWHKNAVSAGGSGSPLQDYYTTRNRMLFGFTYTSVRTKLALVRESLKIFISGRKWQRKGVRDFYLGAFGKGSYKSV